MTAIIERRYWCPVYGWTHERWGDQDCKAKHTPERTTTETQP